MELSLSFPETRVLGALIEKAITTPDQYPLTLNSLTNACNQKSNREPVVSYEESEVQQAADSLIAKRLVTEQSGFGSRVQKYQHRFCNTEFSNLRFSEQELGILCVLFLRGAQTPGELRSRTNRLCSFSDVKEAEVILDNLASRADGPFVRKLPREAGKRESRYVHLFCDEQGEELVAYESDGRLAGAGLEERVDTLEEQVRQLQAQIAVLTEQLSL
ncbi:YceH family protein [Kistimonas scapharcae]|uniref:YceH family protein n=1 Tax=Kistimonas scapharcae TaxID=1036133 RepID=A0ABP8VAC7_9GAMM